MRILICFCISLVLFSCTSNTVYKKPDHLIDEAQITLILSDIYIANAAKYVMNKNQKNNVNYNHNIYQKYHIDSVIFNENLLYYSSKVDLHEQILKEAKKLVKKRLDSLEIIYKDKIREDTLEDEYEEDERDD